MKLNSQTLRSRCVGPLSAAEYLDLSGLGLVSLGRLVSCPRLVTLILRGNRLQDASGLESCRQLWHLDLSNNQLPVVDCLSRFLCLGTLVLSSNQLTWSSLAYLRHTHILILSLHGNSQLEGDPYYRIHVIDCLPNVWMLDGRIVTSAERIQVKQFFQDSALMDRPVRHKLKKDSFFPSTLKNIDLDGIFGEKAVQMMTTFPKHAVLNVDTDWKRLQYLAQVLQDDMNLEWQYTASKPGGLDLCSRPSFMTDLFKARFNDRERCNMVLLMLMASLNFVLPTQLVRDMLDTGRLLTLGSVQTIDLFLLPRLLRYKVVSLLVSAVKVDREQGEDGGVYPKLYLCLYHMVVELSRLSETNPASENVHCRATAQHAKLAEQLEDYKCLLATEVVQLMCIVPSFFDYLDRDIGVMNLVRIATADPDINEKLIQISRIKGEDELSQNEVYKEMANFLLMKVQQQLQNLTNKEMVMSPCDRILSKSDALPMKGEKNPVCKAEYLVKGARTPDDDPPVVNPHKMSAKRNRARFPHLGDKLLLGPQTIGRIILLPQPTMALVIIDAVPVASGAVEHKLKKADQHYTYINMDLLDWDTTHALWKPKGTVGDKYTLQATEDFDREVMGGGLADDSFRSFTPELKGITDIETIRASTPLFFTNTPRQHMDKTLCLQRPLSSVYKEHVKLSLDLSRRAQSAGARQPAALTYGSKASTTKNSKVLALQQYQVSGLKRSLPKPPAHNSPSTFQPFLVASSTTQGHMDSAELAAQSMPNMAMKEDTGKEYKPPEPQATESIGPSLPNTDGPSRSQSDRKQPEGGKEEQDQQKTADRSSQKQSPRGMTSSTIFSAGRPRESGRPPGVSIEAKDGGTEHQADEAVEQTKDIFLTSLSESPRTFTRPYSGYQLAGRSRPVTALERRAKKGKVGNTMYHTEFQQKRVDAWRKTTRPTTATVSHPPPQPPSSPIIPAYPDARKDERAGRAGEEEATPSSFAQHAPPPDPPLVRSPSLESIVIPRSPSPPQPDHQFVPEQTMIDILERGIPQANLWLAGGRDLFWEGVKQRPKSGHTPGWKEGLPESMARTRPRSAAASMPRRTKKPALCPTSTSKEKPVLHGTILNDLLDFPDVRKQVSVSSARTKRYSPQRSLYEEDPLPGPVPESVYRLVPYLSLHAATRVKPAPATFCVPSKSCLISARPTVTSATPAACLVSMRTTCDNWIATASPSILPPATPPPSRLNTYMGNQCASSKFSFLTITSHMCL